MSASLSYVKHRILKILSASVSLLVVGVALWALHHALGEYRYQDVISELRSIPPAKIAGAFLLTVVSYLVLHGYDLLGLKYVGRRLPFRKTSLVSFLAYAIGHNAGFASLGTTSIRYRMYSAWGLSATEIARIVVFCSLTFWVGFASLGSFIFLGTPFEISAKLHFPFLTVQPLGVILFMVLLVYAGVCWRRKTPFRYKSLKLSLPTSKMVAAQILVSSLDWFCAGTTLYCLLPSGTGLTVFHFLGIYLLAQVVGLASHIPGGLGVLESIIVFFVSSPAVPASAVLGAVLIYRVIYYFLPLLAAALILAIYELRLRKILRVSRDKRRDSEIESFRRFFP